MADTEFQEGLSGSEIIEDFVDQIRRKLNKDCNLRDSDRYDVGYAGKAIIELSLFGMDTAIVNVEVPSHKGVTEGKPDVVVQELVTVDHEPDLQVVRTRSEQPTPNMEHSEEPVAPQQAQRKRRYNKSLPSSAAPSGGTENINLE